MTKNILPFSWYGGKFLYLPWLLPILDVPCTHFVDVFGGSGSVILNRAPSPIETYNDLDGELVNFFRCLREWPIELIRLLSYTPYSREEFGIAIDSLRSGNVPVSKKQRIEHARMYFTKARMAFCGLSQTVDSGSWSNSKGEKDKSVNRWHNSIDMLSAISNRLLRVQIENRDAISLIKRIDHKDVLFYCDPPYMFEMPTSNTKCYGNELTDDDHVELAAVLNSCEGKVAISFYANADLTIEKLYPRKKWTRHLAEPRKLNGPSKRIVQEMVLTNYK